jgi:sterol desaturase/sphingolipid hydroxylase (fatty acid hydroxylase superfamily)
MDAFLGRIGANYDPSRFWIWGAVALSLLIIHGFELVLPAKRGQGYRSIRFNVLAAVTYLALTPIAHFLPGYIVTATVQAAHGPWLAIDLSRVLAGQSGWLRIPLLLLFSLVSLFVFDFFYYWYHRLQHANGWLWEQHKLHHTDEAVNVTTSLRHHWTEGGFRGILIAMPMNILFKITPVESGVVTMLIAQWGYITHANVRLPLGPLSALLAGPQVHRIHHSIRSEHHNKNFCAFYPIWDILFGTFYWPHTDEFPETGVIGEIGRPGLMEVLFGPFIAWWWRILKSIPQTRRRSRGHLQHESLGQRLGQCSDGEHLLLAEDRTHGAQNVPHAR